MKNIILITAVIFITCSCQVSKTLYLSNIDKGATTQEYSYETAPLEIPKPDWADAYNKANAKCKQWGYEKAVFIEQGERKCILMTSSGCASYKVSYKCYCE